MSQLNGILLLSHLLLMGFSPCLSLADNFVLLPPSELKLPPINTGFMPTSSYEYHLINGVEILLAPEIKKDKELTQKILDRLSVQTESVGKLLPIQKLKTLMPIRIWVELNARELGYAEYHAYEEWIKVNRYNPHKYKCIEISNVINYLNWSSEDPLISSVLIHEIAHVYYHRLSIEAKAKVQQVYNQAKNNGLYQNSVRLGTHKSGKSFPLMQAWALQDEWEYFSELTESLFAKNDYFPHTSKQLAEYDPSGYQLIRSLWE
jgi:hypothetical protein